MMDGGGKVVERSREFGPKWVARPTVHPQKVDADASPNGVQIGDDDAVHRPLYRQPEFSCR